MISTHPDIIAPTSILCHIPSVYSRNDMPPRAKFSTISDSICISETNITLESGEYDSINVRISENNIGEMLSMIMRLISGEIDSIDSIVFSESKKIDSIVDVTNRSDVLRRSRKLLLPIHSSVIPYLVDMWSALVK